MPRVAHVVRVFVYGSLVAPAEAARTLKRPVTVVPARVEGLVRDWCVGTAGRAYRCLRCGGRLPVAVVLGVRPAPGHVVAGALLTIAPGELPALDRREASYVRHPLAPDAMHASAPLDGPVLTYVPRPVRLADALLPGAAIPAVYERTVERAFREAGGDVALRAFRETTAPSALPRRVDLEFAGADRARREPLCGCEPSADAG